MSEASANAPEKISMMSRKKGAIALFFCLVIFLGSSVYLQKEHILTPERVSLTDEYQLGMLPSGEYAKTMTFGYDAMGAHWLWLRSILSFGGLYSTPAATRDYQPILHLFDVITDLEPRFVEAYKFGALVIGEEAGEPERSLELIDKGIIKNQRRTYEIAHLAVFQHIYGPYQHHDYQAAKYYLALTLKCRDCPPHLRNWDKFIDKKLGHYRIAVEKWLADYLTELDNDNQMYYEMRLKSTMDYIREWGINVLDEALVEFKEKEGRMPESFDEILEHQLLADLEIYNWRRIEMAIENFRQQGGPLRPRLDEILAFSLIPGNNLPENPYNPTDEGFIIASYLGKVYDRNQLRDDIDNMLNNPESGFRATLKLYFDTYGLYPAKFSDIPGMTNQDGSLLYPEPFAGEWDYDPVNGIVKSVGFPEL